MQHATAATKLPLSPAPSTGGGGGGNEPPPGKTSHDDDRVKRILTVAAFLGGLVYLGIVPAVIFEAHNQKYVLLSLLFQILSFVSFVSVVMLAMLRLTGYLPLPTERQQAGIDALKEEKRWIRIVFTIARYGRYINAVTWSEFAGSYIFNPVSLLGLTILGVVFLAISVLFSLWGRFQGSWVFYASLGIFAFPFYIAGAYILPHLYGYALHFPFAATKDRRKFYLTLMRKHPLITEGMRFVSPSLVDQLLRDT